MSDCKNCSNCCRNPQSTVNLITNTASGAIKLATAANRVVNLAGVATNAARIASENGQSRSSCYSSNSGHYNPVMNQVTTSVTESVVHSAMESAVGRPVNPQLSKSVVQVTKKNANATINFMVKANKLYNETLGSQNHHQQRK